METKIQIQLRNGCARRKHYQGAHGGQYVGLSARSAGTSANEQERAQVRTLAQVLQYVTDETVKLALVDQGYSREEPTEAAKAEYID